MSKSIVKALAALLPSLRQAGALPAAAGAGIAARRYSKATTGIVGLPVDEEAREHLREALEEVLTAIKVIPEKAEYRRSIEATVQAKLEAVGSEVSDAALEDQFGRQLEQEIKLCKDELKLIPKMAEWAPWDVPESHTIEVLEEKDVEEKVAGGAAPTSPPPPPPPPPK